MCNHRTVAASQRTFMMKKMWTAWGFHPSVLAYQITLIDIDLFLQVRNTNLKFPKQKKKKQVLGNASPVHFGRKNKH
jgi:hypothetical protein